MNPFESDLRLGVWIGAIALGLACIGAYAVFLVREARAQERDHARRRAEMRERRRRLGMHESYDREAERGEG